MDEPTGKWNQLGASCIVCGIEINLDSHANVDCRLCICELLNLALTREVRYSHERCPKQGGCYTATRVRTDVSHCRP